MYLAGYRVWFAGSLGLLAEEFRLFAKSSISVPIDHNRSNCSAAPFRGAVAPAEKYRQSVITQQRLHARSETTPLCLTAEISQGPMSVLVEIHWKNGGPFISRTSHSI